MDWEIKNHPKLHMVKAPQDGVTPQYAIGYHGYLQHTVVWSMWIRERSLRTLKLVIPSQCRSRPFDMDVIRHQICYPWIWDEIMMNFLAKTQVIVEDGALFPGPRHVLGYGWDVVALPGSRVTEGDLDLPPVAEGILDPQDRVRVWKSDLDYLTGVMQLFEIEEFSTHANNGMAQPRPDPSRVRRVLKGFGPCVIIVDCVECGCGNCWHYWQIVHDGTKNRPAFRCSRRYRSLVDWHEGNVLPDCTPLTPCNHYWLHLNPTYRGIAWQKYWMKPHFEPDRLRSHNYDYLAYDTWVAGEAALCRRNLTITHT